MKYEELFTQTDSYFSTLPTNVRQMVTQFLASASLQPTVREALVEIASNSTKNDSTDNDGITVIAFEPGVLPPSVTLNELYEWGEKTNQDLSKHSFYSEIRQSWWYASSDEMRKFLKAAAPATGFVILPLCLIGLAAMNVAYHNYDEALNQLLAALLLLTFVTLVAAYYCFHSNINWAFRQSVDNIQAAARAGREKFGFLRTVVQNSRILK